MQRGSRVTTHSTTTLKSWYGCVSTRLASRCDHVRSSGMLGMDLRSRIAWVLYAVSSGNGASMGYVVAIHRVYKTLLDTTDNV